VLIRLVPLPLPGNRQLRSKEKEEMHHRTLLVLLMENVRSLLSLCALHIQRNPLSIAAWSHFKCPNTFELTAGAARASCREVPSLR